MSTHSAESATPLSTKDPNDMGQLPLVSVAFEVTREVPGGINMLDRLDRLAAAVEHALRDHFPDFMIRRLDASEVLDQVWR